MTADKAVDTATGAAEVVYNRDWKHMRCPLAGITEAAGGGSSLDVAPKCFADNNTSVPNLGFPFFVHMLNQIKAEAEAQGVDLIESDGPGGVGCNRTAEALRGFVVISAKNRQTPQRPRQLNRHILLHQRPHLAGDPGDLPLPAPAAALAAYFAWFRRPTWESTGDTWTTESTASGAGSTLPSEEPADASSVATGLSAAETSLASSRYPIEEA